MTWLSNWWMALTSEDQFEIVKIVLDKGLLALLIALVGFYFSRYLEKYKSFEMRRLELEKTVIPRVYALMNDADTLFREGRKTTQELDKAYQLEWDPWLDRLIASRIKPIDDPSFNVTSVELLNRRLQSGLTLREHIVAQAPNENIKRRLETVVEFGPEPMFLTNLFNLYTDPTSPVFKKPKALLSQAFLLDFFKAVTREERQAFVQRASDFLITAKNVISVHKLQILDGVGTGISAMKFAVEEFPVPGKEDNLANGYLAIWSQLHEVVAP